MRATSMKHIVMDDVYVQWGQCTRQPRILYIGSSSESFWECSVKGKNKFPKKIMVSPAISERGVTKPSFCQSRGALDGESYRKECATKRLVPFIEEKTVETKSCFGRTWHRTITLVRRKRCSRRRAYRSCRRRTTRHAAHSWDSSRMSDLCLRPKHTQEAGKWRMTPSSFEKSRRASAPLTKRLCTRWWRGYHSACDTLHAQEPIPASTKQQVKADVHISSLWKLYVDMLNIMCFIKKWILCKILVLTRY